MEEKLIKNAKHSLEIAGYCGGKPFHEILLIIEKKLQENPHFKVRIISTPTLTNPEEMELYLKLMRQYPNNFEVLESRAVWSLHPTLLRSENHTKMVVADQKFFLTGGTSITNHLLPHGQVKKAGGKGMFLSNGNTDIDLLGEGEGAKILKEEFDVLWKKWKEIRGVALNPKLDLGSDLSKIPDNDKIQINVIPKESIRNVQHDFVFGHPEQGKNNQAELAYIRLISGAKKSIYISNMVFNNKVILKEIESAARRGVKITIISNGDLDGKTSTGSKLIGLRNRPSFKKLLELGKKLSKEKIRIYEYAKKDIMLHTKVMVIDAETEDPISVVGSFNISKESARTDDEMIMIIKSKALSDLTVQKLDLIRADSEEITEKLMKTFSFKFSCFKGRLLEMALKGIIN